MTKNKELKEKRLMLQFLQQHITQLSDQVAEIRGKESELISLNESLEYLKDLKPDTKIMVPMGAGLFIKGKMSKGDNLLMNVGSGVVVEKNIKSAREMIGDKLDEIKKISENAKTELEKAINHANVLEQDLSQQE